MGHDTSLPRLSLRHAPRPELRLLAFIGTRPEAVKIAPVALAVRAREDVEMSLVSSGQHPREMLEALRCFGLEVDGDLGLFEQGQTLADVTATALRGFAFEVAARRPDVVLVQGDTTSAFAGALSAFYARVPVAHIEAGLRTNDPGNPFPEEMNRKLIDDLSRFLFPPTASAALNLTLEGVTRDRFFVAGNTIVDSLAAMRREAGGPVEDPVAGTFMASGRWQGRVLATTHRRESWGTGIDEIAAALASVAGRFPEHGFLLPLHPNPIVRRSFRRPLPPNVLLCGPLPYAAFVRVLEASDVVLTDSGGVVEEATALGKAIVVARALTERPEAVAAGTAEVVGVERESLERALVSRLEGGGPAPARLPVFGDGHAGERIVDWLRFRFGLRPAPPEPFEHGALRAPEPTPGAGAPSSSRTGRPRPPRTGRSTRSEAASDRRSR